MEKCQECGYMHPYTPKGQCPVARSEKMAASDKGRKIVEFTSKLSSILHESDDYENIIKSIRELLKI